MRPVALSQLAAWCEGRHLVADVTINAVGTDTRHLQPGPLSVALRGGNFAAPDFLAAPDARRDGPAVAGPAHSLPHGGPAPLKLPTPVASFELPCGAAFLLVVSNWPRIRHVIGRSERVSRFKNSPKPQQVG